MSEPRPGMSDVVRVTVDVLFLSMQARPATIRPLADGVRLERVGAPTVPFYRYLYETVGAAHLWWLRRVVSDAAIAELLAHPALSLHVLYRDGAPAGFFELDGRGQSMNLSYFGLLPHAIGLGLGRGFLGAAVAAAWSADPKSVTVNTCTADHPNALPGYIDAGFRPFRQVRETWEVPRSLGLVVPPHLR